MVSFGVTQNERDRLNGNPKKLAVRPAWSKGTGNFFTASRLSKGGSNSTPAETLLDESAQRQFNPREIFRPRL
jgi:hypothetical protein